MIAAYNYDSGLTCVEPTMRLPEPTVNPLGAR